MGRRREPSRRKSPHLGPRTRGYSDRPTNRRSPRIRFLIVAEGKRTEPNYFRAFPVESARVVVKGVGMNTLSLVTETVRIRDEFAKNDEHFDQVWAIFDRDSFSPASVNQAFALAKREGIRVAFTNEAFELWYLLHFMYCDAALSREQYAQKLSAFLGRKYRKNDPEMFALLEQKLPTALRNARKLARMKPGRDNPSTTVHLLVEELLRWIRRVTKR